MSCLCLQEAIYCSLLRYTLSADDTQLCAPLYSVPLRKKWSIIPWHCVNASPEWDPLSSWMDTTSVFLCLGQAITEAEFWRVHLPSLQSDECQDSPLNSDLAKQVLLRDSTIAVTEPWRKKWQPQVHFGEAHTSSVPTFPSPSRTGLPSCNFCLN